jgi:hypothetical protein
VGVDKEGIDRKIMISAGPSPFVSGAFINYELSLSTKNTTNS